MQRNLSDDPEFVELLWTVRMSAGFVFNPLMRQGRSQIGRMSTVGALPLVAYKTCAHGARIIRTKTLRLYFDRTLMHPRQRRGPKPALCGCERLLQSPPTMGGPRALEASTRGAPRTKFKDE